MFIFPRKSTKYQERSPCFDVACVEVGGQLPIKTKEEYDRLTFEQAYKNLEKESITSEEFSNLTKDVTSIL